MPDHAPLSAPNPVNLVFPDTFDTQRLTLRAPRAGDGPAINAAVVESSAELRPWLPWADPVPTVAESEDFACQSAVAFARRERLALLVFLRGTDTLIGSSGFHHIDWSVPRLEIGYWLRTSCTGCGYMVEAVRAQVAFARDALKACRVDLVADDQNGPSCRVAERAGFTFDAILRHDRRDRAGVLRNTRIYSRIFTYDRSIASPCLANADTPSARKPGLALPGV